MLEIMIDPVADLIGQKQNDRGEEFHPQRAAIQRTDRAKKTVKQIARYFKVSASTIRRRIIK